MTWEYIAGFFDGEGCITLYDYERKRTYKDKPDQNHTLGKAYTSRENRAVVTIGQRTRMFVIMNQVDNTVLEDIGRFLDKNGVEYKIRKVKRDKIKNPNWNDFSVLSITRHRSVLKFLTSIYDSLIVKREKARITIDYINNKEWYKHTKHETGWHHVKS